MARFIYQGTYKDSNGKVVGAETTANSTDGVVSVYLAGTTTAASIYTAASGGTAVNSVETDDYGHFSFYVDTDDYAASQQFKITLSHANFLSKTYDNIQIFPYSWNHVSSTDTGASHTYIDQDVTSSAAPFFTGTNFIGIPASGISSTDRTGSQTMVVTGTSSSDGALAKWDANGDLMSSSFAPSDLVISTDVDYDLVTTNSTGTDVTQAELEELSDGSISTLHRHGWTYGSQTATTSSTSVELISNISTDAQEVEVLLNGVGTNTNSVSPKIQLGSTGGYEETGYLAASSRDTGDGAGAETSTSAFPCSVSDDTPANEGVYGILRLSRWDAAEEMWIASGTSTPNGTSAFVLSGTKTLAANLTSIRLQTGSTAAFDAGEARVRYR